ncbi:MAG: Crp/Fnr family transcriptional regulator, partial [Sphingomonadaceae bacterium]|nr:Crp/Fnr family transcriptional regulator [Sphingomonadaceae bacterium]
MNRLIAALTPADLAILGPEIVIGHYAVGDVLHKAGEPITAVYFPYRAIVAHSALQDGGAPVETGTVGCEGVVAAAALVGDDLTFERATVQVPGEIAAIPIEAVRGLRERSTAFRALLGAYRQAYVALLAQSAVCNASHTSEARLSRWLLMCVDRTRGAAHVPFDNRMLAETLAICRPTVTVIASALQTAGLIAIG